MSKRAKTVKKVRDLLDLSRADIEMCEELSVPSRDLLENLFIVTEELLDLVSRTSKNSHLPPSQDSERVQRSKEESESSGSPRRKRGGQPGREGKNLPLAEHPDHIVELRLDHRTLPKGRTYVQEEPERRQVFDVEITRVVTEYQAEVVRDEKGKRYVAPFPEGVRAPTQYGLEVKVQGVLLGVEHAVPFGRVAEYFAGEYELPLSPATLVNNEACVAAALEKTFKPEAIAYLQEQPVVGFDETGTNVGGRLRWVHEASDGQVVLFTPSEHRGARGMSEMGILPHFKGVAVHDFWRSYYSFDCTHALCNAHHLRELKKIAEEPKQVWAQGMYRLLNEMNDARKLLTRNLNKKRIAEFERRYDALVAQGLRLNPGKRKHGRRRSKARCLLDRFKTYKQDVLRFLYDHSIPFTNNDVERPIRMFKVEMKVAGYFNSLATAERSLLIRSYLLTCKRFGIPPRDAIRRVFENNIPSIKELLARQTALAA